MNTRKKISFRLPELLLVIFVLFSGILLAFKSGGFVINVKNIGFSVLTTVERGFHSVLTGVKDTFLAVGELATLKKEYEENLNQVKKDKKKTIKNIKNKFDAEMMEARSEIKNILEELRKEKSEKIARRAYSRLAKIEQDFRQDVENASDKNKYIEIDWDKVKIGDEIMLKELHQKVKVVTLPDKHKRLTVDMGAMTMKVKQDELAVLDENYKAPKKVKIPGTSFNSCELKKYSMSQTLDLRGYRVEEALDEVENYLDMASLANLSPIYIIHGHGTGALKQAVRDFLKDSPYVAKFRAGGEGEGGYGVTIVTFK